MPVRRILRPEGGQDLVEYGLLASLVSLAALAGVEMLGTSVGALWHTIVGQLEAFFS